MPKAKFTSRTSWRSKLEKPQERAVCPLPPKMREKLGDGTLLIPTPLDVDAAVREIPRGTLISMSRLRQTLAQSHGATTACPLCTGIFLRIAAEAAEEDLTSGKKTITPWWRVVDDNGALKPKLPGGGKLQAKRLRREGHRISPGKTP